MSQTENEDVIVLQPEIVRDMGNNTAHIMQRKISITKDHAAKIVAAGAGDLIARIEALERHTHQVWEYKYGGLVDITPPKQPQEKQPDKPVEQAGGDVAKSAEQKAREILARMGIDNSERFSSGDLVELANMIAERNGLRANLAQEKAEHHEDVGKCSATINDLRAELAQSEQYNIELRQREKSAFECAEKAEKERDEAKALLEKARPVLDQALDALEDFKGQNAAAEEIRDFMPSIDAWLAAAKGASNE